MSDSGKEIWFPAKKYGWGWGLPITWQGWLVFLGYMVLLIWGAAAFRNNISVFVFYTLFISFVLIAVCWAKGERPRWRWGD